MTWSQIIVDLYKGPGEWKTPLKFCWTDYARHWIYIKEEGPKGTYTLSLYVVHKTINDQWQDWLDKEMFGGLPMLPDKRKLDSIRLILKYPPPHLTTPDPRCIYKRTRRR